MSKEQCREWYRKNAEYQKQKQQDRRKFNIKNGICLDCANKLKPEEHRRCFKCKSKRNNYRKNRVSNGLCWWCGKERDIPSLTFCSVCRKKKNDERNKRNRGNKLLGVTLLGGKCSMCGFKTNVLDVYDFHHIDPSKKNLKDKERIVANLSGEEMINELKKCMLVCSNCHRIIHRDEGI